MAKLMGSIMTVLAVLVIAFASSGCTTNNTTTERVDKPAVTEKTTEKTTERQGHGDKVTTETKTTRE